MANLGELSWWALRESWLGSRLPQTLASAFYITKWLNVLVSSSSHFPVFIFPSSLHTSHLWAHTGLVSAAPLTANLPRSAPRSHQCCHCYNSYYRVTMQPRPRLLPRSTLPLHWYFSAEPRGGWHCLEGRDHPEFSTGWNNPAPPLQDLFWRLQKETLSQKPTTKTNLRKSFGILS